MGTQLLAALITSIGVVAAAVITACVALVVSWQWKEKRRSKAETAISKFHEPLARAAQDLQSRIYNILRQDFIEAYLREDNERQRSYAVNNTTFLVAQYFAWTELTRREVIYVGFKRHKRMRKLTELQDEIQRVWATDRLPPAFMVFAGEQRAIGEALIRESASGPDCVGYGAFLRDVVTSNDKLIDAVSNDVQALATHLDQARPRLDRLQHALIDLLQHLDPHEMRFPGAKRSKV